MKTAENQTHEKTAGADKQEKAGKPRLFLICEKSNTHFSRRNA